MHKRHRGQRGGCWLLSPSRPSTCEIFRKWSIVTITTEHTAPDNAGQVDLQVFVTGPCASARARSLSRPNVASRDRKGFVELRHENKMGTASQWDSESLGRSIGRSR